MQIKTTLLAAVSVLVAVLFCLLLDHTVIRIYADRIAIPRTTRMFYATPEFDCTADINSLGFRDREWPPEKNNDQIRIAVLGDSFTFGWGVDEEKSWPRILEKKLRSMGHQVMVMNLAEPGYFPYMYAQYASIYFPAVKPDIVLIGVLQGDDLIQMAHGDCTEPEKPPLRDAPPPPEACKAKDVSRQQFFKPNFQRLQILFKKIFRRLIPNTLRVRSYRMRTQSQNVYAIWRRMADDICANFSPEQAERFSQLDKNIRDMFLSGGLNPSLVQAGVQWPDLHCNVWNLDSSTTKDLIRRMANCLKATKESSRLHGAKTTAVLAIPYGMYVSERSHQNWLRIGFLLLPEMLIEDNADRAIKMACRKAAVSLITVTEDFRELAADEVLYFTYDGHFNARGHALYADLITPHVLKLIQQARN